MAEKAEKAQAAPPAKDNESEQEGIQLLPISRRFHERWDDIFVEMDRKHEATIEDMKAGFVEGREKMKQDSQMSYKEQVLSLLKTVEERRDLEAKMVDTMLKIMQDVEKMGVSLQEAIETAGYELELILEETQAGRQ